MKMSINVNNNLDRKIRLGNRNKHQHYDNWNTIIVKKSMTKITAIENNDNN